MKRLSETLALLTIAVATNASIAVEPKGYEEQVQPFFNGFPNVKLPPEERVNSLDDR